MDDARILLPVADTDPHLHPHLISVQTHVETAWEVKVSTHLPECTQAGQNAASDPGAVFPLGRGPDLDAHVLDRQLLDFVQEPVAEALGERRAARQDDVAEQGLAQVHVGAVDGVHDHVVQPRVLEPDDLRVEEDLRGPEAFGADLDRCTSTSSHAIDWRF